MPKPLDRLFARPKPIVAVLHVGPSPGVPGYNSVDCAVRRAVAEAKLLMELGVDGFFLENTYDVPAVPERVMGPEVGAFLTRVATAVKREAPRLPLGVRVVPGAGRTALAVALAAGGDLAGVAGWDRADAESAAGSTLRYRKRIGGDALPLWAELRTHVGETAESVAVRAQLAERHRADVLVLVGPGVGVPPSLEAVEACADAVHLPVLVGSGLDAENLAAYAGVAAGFVVGSALKEQGHWSAPVCERRVRQLVGAAEYARGQETQTLR